MYHAGSIVNNRSFVNGLILVMVFALIAGCRTAPAAPAATSSSQNNQIPRKEIDEIVAPAKGRVGVYAIEFENDEIVASYNADDHFPMQSVYKLPICMAVIKQVGEGKLKLDQTVTVTKQDYIGRAGHSPIRDKNPNGTELQLSEWIRFAIAESDGTASDVLMKLAGGPDAVQSFMSELGVKELIVRDTEQSLIQNTSLQYRNYSTPKAAVDLLRALQEKRRLPEAGQQLLLRYMIESTPGAMRLKRLLPNGTVVAHKTGTSLTERGITAATNDIGIISLPSGHHLGIAVFVSDSPADNATRENVIARIAKVVFDSVMVRAAVPTFRMKSVAGQAVYAAPNQKWEAGPAGGVSLSLFKTLSHDVVARMVTDDKGQFQFLDFAPGQYTLVASAGDLQVLSIAIELAPATATIKPNRLLLHLREQQDQRKAYVTEVSNPALREELLSMHQRDQNIRNEMISAGVDHPSKDITTRMDTIDRENTARMMDVINQFGWPSAALVGWDGTGAAFILVQHADQANHKKLLPLIVKEYKAGNVSGPNYALFIDRALVEEGKPQTFGTRAKPFAEWQSGKPALYPIEDEANVDKRRAEVGLSPLAEYLEQLTRMYYPRGRE
jgi:beta-lactamase class A